MNWIYKKKVILVFSGIILSLFLLEFSLFVYGGIYLNKKRIYDFDSKVGYRLKEKLNCSRRFTNYNIQLLTDNFGVRISDINEMNRTSIFPYSAKKRRVLITGDSFAEGQTDARHRFDYQINILSNKYHATSIGCGGYGPSQQILFAQRFIHDLRKDDVFLLLTCGNDFGDISRKTIFGRSKPQLTISGNHIQIKPPDDSFLYYFRDKSFLLGYSLQFLDAYNMKWNFSDQEVRDSHDIYCSFVETYFNELKNLNIIPVIFLHSLKWTRFINELELKLHSKNLNFVNLSDSLSNKVYLSEDNFHWNERGNLKIAKDVINYLDNKFEN